MRALFPVTFAATLVTLAIALSYPGAQKSTPSSHGYLGFDLNGYPGDEALPVLRKTFSFTSYWLSPPPGEKHNSWIGKRSLLQSQGFGFVALFSGRASRTIHNSGDARQKATQDAQAAANEALQEGFTKGIVIFLDIEEGGRLPAPYHEYIQTWYDTLLRAGFHAGVYCSGVPVDEGAGATITTANDILTHIGSRKLVYWVFNDACPPAPGCAFPSNPPPPAQSGFPAATVWQYAQSPRRKERTAQCSATYAPDGNCYVPGDTAHKWFLDANVSTLANPSSPH